MKNNKFLTFCLILSLPFTGVVRADDTHVQETAPEELDTLSERQIAPERFVDPEATPPHEEPDLHSEEVLAPRHFYGEEAPRTMPPPAENLDATPSDTDAESSKLDQAESSTDDTAEAAPAADRPPREVGAAATGGFDTAKRKQLGNFAIAVITIAVATTAVLLVSKHEGKRS